MSSLVLGRKCAVSRCCFLWQAIKVHHCRETNLRKGVILSSAFTKQVSTSTAIKGKNVYYHYAQKKNEHRSGFQHRATVIFMVSSLLALFFGFVQFINDMLSTLRMRGGRQYQQICQTLLISRPLCFSKLPVVVAANVQHGIDSGNYRHARKFLSPACPLYSAHEQAQQRDKLSGATILVSGVVFSFFAWGIKSKYRLAVSAREQNEAVEGKHESSNSSEDESDVKKRQKISFRDKRIIEYENRIRNYSTPDKIFRYFATLRVKKDSAQDGGDIYMTPEDFVRSLLPGIKQPEGLGLDQFRKFDPDVDSLPTDEDTKIKLRDDSIFYHLEKHGLISFSDYIFLLTLLSTPPKQFELAFKMFDENGDGNLDQQEYAQVQSIIRSRTSVGKRHRDHSTTGSVLKTEPDGVLSTYFFGKEGHQKLSHQKFLEFHRDLQNEILWIEFHQFADERGRLSERDFANQILIYADFSEQKRIATCRRIRKEFKNDNQGVTFQEYLDFAYVLKNINEIDTALTFYHVAGAAIDKATLKHVAKTVAKVNLTDHIVDVVFAIFDENDDERLSNKEFVSVMKRRLMRGLEKPRETGFAKFFSAVMTCAKSQLSEAIEQFRGNTND